MLFRLSPAFRNARDGVASDVCIAESTTPSKAAPDISDQLTIAHCFYMIPCDICSKLRAQSSELRAEHVALYVQYVVSEA